MSFISALASCWNVCRRRCSLQPDPTLSGFYETYQLPRRYTLRNLPPGIYRNKHSVETVYFDAQENRSYGVRVGLTSVEDKLVNSFFGLPFAILESLWCLLQVIGILVLMGLAGLCFAFVLALSPLALFVVEDPIIVGKALLVTLFGVVAALALAIYALFQAVYRPLQALIKIPVGIVIGIYVLINLALGREIDPPTISEIDSLESRDAMRQQGVTVRAVDNELEIALKNIGFNLATFPDRYLCPIGAGVIEPVLLNDGHIYAKSTAEGFFDKESPVGPYDRTPLQRNLLPVAAYYTEAKALVDVLVAEHGKAGAEKRAPNYDLILQCAQKHSAIAEELHKQLTSFFEAGKSVNGSVITSIAITAQNQPHQFKVSASTIQAANF